jgi:hypothetical protein
LADYEPVEERLARFWADHPNGRVQTEMIADGSYGPTAAMGDPRPDVIMRATVWKDKGQAVPDATGHAQETPGSNPVNKTSWIENCETSAIGRALANMGYAPKGQRPSREEMAKAAAPRSTSPPRRAGSRTPKLRASQINLLQAAKDAKVDDDLRHRISVMLTGTASVKEMTDDEADKVTRNLAWFSMHRAPALAELEEWEQKNGIA